MGWQSCCAVFVGKVGKAMQESSSEAVGFVVSSLLRARDRVNLSTYETFDKFLSVCEAAFVNPTIIQVSKLFGAAYSPG
jgi:hypothetical protein